LHGSVRIRLLSCRTGVIHVVTVITAKGEIKMTELTAETAGAQAPASSEQPKASKKGRVAKPGAHVSTKKGKSAKKADPAKKAPKAPKGAKKTKVGPRRQQDG
jgi:hypothetical protein